MLTVIKGNQPFYRQVAFFLTVLFICLPTVVLAGATVSIVEIMYDLEGADADREWIEIVNTTNSPVSVADWRLFEANTNHKLTLVSGSEILPAGGVAVIADNVERFRLDWPTFTGTLFDSVFSLSNTGETISLKNAALEIVDEVSYTSAQGAAGDGKSLVGTGNLWQAATPTPGTVPSNQSPGPTSPVSTSTPESQSNQEAPPANEPPVQNSGSLVPYTPPLPRIYAFAGDDLSGIVGAAMTFSGRALGLKKEPLEGARFLWSFGDGGFAEGSVVTHTFSFPGTYAVSLDVSSGGFSGSDRLVATVREAAVSIIGQTAGVAGGVVVRNNSRYELDLSSWSLRSGTTLFFFPLRTIILPETAVTFANQITGLTVTDLPTALLYPNGVIATEFKRDSQSIAGAPHFSASNTIKAETGSKQTGGVLAPSPSTTQSGDGAGAATPVSALKQARNPQASGAVLAVASESLPPLGQHQRGIIFWFLGALGISAAGAGAFVLIRRRRPDNPSDDFTIVE
jgi:hypothetical protein